jgi:hypothetical protein
MPQFFLGIDKTNGFAESDLTVIVSMFILHGHSGLSLP